MYDNHFEENKNNQVEEIAIPNQENYNKEEVKEQIKEEKNKSVENKNNDNTKKKKRTYKDYGLTPAKVLKFTKIAENDLKLEEIVKSIKKYAKELGVEDTKFFLQKIEEDIKNNFEKKSFESLKPKEEKR